MGASINSWNGAERRQSDRSAEVFALAGGEPLPEWELLPAHIEYERAAWLCARASVAGALMPLAEVIGEVFGDQLARSQAMDPKTNYGAF